MSIQVLPTAPSPTVTHLMNLAALVPIAAKTKTQQPAERTSRSEREREREGQGRKGRYEGASLKERK
ncbi:unnamed protein product [Spirodela intermedia]|uniref:Uncharacterized protein n=1 Tax=Spirodela intermedia TaxID=51605 RepID=A0A7I8LAL3_SPIIN|nr:unnamed protein product [Spirodela intermedia]